MAVNRRVSKMFWTTRVEKLTTGQPNKYFAEWMKSIARPILIVKRYLLWLHARPIRRKLSQKESQGTHPILFDLLYFHYDMKTDHLLLRSPIDISSDECVVLNI